MQKKSEYNLTEFGKRLRAVRKQKGISQPQLAKLLGYKNGASVSNMEKAKSPPDVRVLAEIADALELKDLHWLITGEQCPQITELAKVLLPFVHTHLAESLEQSRKLDNDLRKLKARAMMGELCQDELERVQEARDDAKAHYQAVLQAMTDILSGLGVAL